MASTICVLCDEELGEDTIKVGDVAKKSMQNMSKIRKDGRHNVIR